jgi:hypothetical protein
MTTSLRGQDSQFADTSPLQRAPKTGSTRFEKLSSKADEAWAGEESSRSEAKNAPYTAEDNCIVSYSYEVLPLAAKEK